VRFLSCEPLLGPVDLLPHMPAVDPYDSRETEEWGIDWIIVGGESGHGARPMHPDWARSLRDQCTEAGIPFLFKQWGEFRYLDTTNPYVWREDGDHLEPVRQGKKAAGRVLDGRTWDEYPERVA